MTAVGNGHSDALVFFGATGDLAYKKIFPALYAMARRGKLDVPIVGVARSGWTRDQLIERARASVSAHGEPDDAAFATLAAALRYVDGDYADSATFTALRKEQNPQRAATLQPVMWDSKFECLKVNPILDWTPVEMDAYLAEHQLPNERTYYDPAKGDEKHECGLHAKLVTDAKG